MLVNNRLNKAYASSLCPAHPPSPVRNKEGTGPGSGFGDMKPFLVVYFGHFFRANTVDGPEILRSPVEVGSLSHYLQGLYNPGG